MATPTKQISTSVGFQNGQGTLVANGLLSLQLEFASEVIATGGQVTTQPLLFPLDSNAKITTTAIWFSDELSSSPRYRAILYGSNLSTIVQDYGYWSIVGASADLSTIVTTSAGALPGVVLLNPVLTQTVAQPNGTSLTVSGLTKLIKGTSTSPYIMQIVDAGGLNSQIITFNIEQEINPTSAVGYLNFIFAGEMFTPTSNSQTFTGSQQTIYGSFSHFGSGALTAGYGGDFEAFNSGPAAAGLIAGCTATANNGGVAAGNPVQTPTNNGTATNLRAFDGICKNLSSGTVTNAAAFYAEAAIKPGGGTITNAWGLLVADQTVATNNWAIQTGIGKVQFGDNVICSSTANFNGLIGQTGGTSAAAGMFLQASPSTGLSGTTQIGVRIATTTGSDATAEGSGFWVRCDTPNVAFTQALNTGIHVFTPTKGAASTITEWNGVRIEAGPTAGSTFAIKTVGTDPLSLGGKVTTYNAISTEGQGLSTVRKVTSQKAESAADTNVLTFTPDATVGSYRVRFTMAVSAQNTATLGWTATWKDANGSAQAPTNLSLFTSGTAAPALTVTASTNGNYYGSIDIDTDNSATAIVVKLTFTGTSFAAKVTVTVERIA